VEESLQAAAVCAPVRSGSSVIPVGCPICSPPATAAPSSAYGDRHHEDRHTRSACLGAVIEHALRDGGTVLIPAFSIGRTQELRLIAGSGSREDRRR